MRSSAIGARLEVAIRGSRSRRFLWATWRSVTVRRLLAEADVVVAIDTEAVPAAWFAARRNRRAVVTVGVPAAASLLAHARAR